MKFLIPNLRSDFRSNPPKKIHIYIKEIYICISIFYLYLKKSILTNAQYTQNNYNFSEGSMEAKQMQNI